MKIQDVPFITINWKDVPTTRHSGETGFALWQTLEVGNIRVRIVEYSPGYFADHWCSRGHVVFILEGEIQTELQNGRTFTLSKGTSYQVADNAESHRSSTTGGAKLFIVD